MIIKYQSNRISLSLPGAGKGEPEAALYKKTHY